MPEFLRIRLPKSKISHGVARSGDTITLLFGAKICLTEFLPLKQLLRNSNTQW